MFEAVLTGVCVLKLSIINCCKPFSSTGCGGGSMNGILHQNKGFEFEYCM